MDPSSLRIVRYPDPALRRRSATIDPLDPAVADIARRMIELMYEAEGIGLAAPQVGLAWSLFVAHVPEHDGRSASENPATATPGPVVYANPVFQALIGAPEPYEEGCLSLPGIRGDVLRPESAILRATDLQGREFETTATGLLARCWQHEMDHLDGVLIIDRFTQMSRLKTRAAVRALERG